MSGSPCSKNNKFIFFWGKLYSLSREAATLTPGTHREGRESNSPYKKRAAPILLLLFAMCCILGLLLMQAGARHYQWLSGKLADHEFSSGNRADIFQFSVWTKSRAHFIWRESLPSWGSHPLGLAEAVQCWLRLVTALCTRSSLGASPLHTPLTCSNSLLLPPAASPNPWNHTIHPTEGGSSPGANNPSAGLLPLFQ